MAQVEEGLRQQLFELKKIDNKQMQLLKLFSKLYFRDDCNEKFDDHGLSYRHKNLSKIMTDLSALVMIDDNPMSYRGYEAIRCAGYWGQSNPIDNHVTYARVHSLQLT